MGGMAIDTGQNETNKTKLNQMLTFLVTGSISAVPRLVHAASEPYAHRASANQGSGSV